MYLADLLKESASGHPDRIAITHQTKQISFSQLWRAVNLLSRHIETRSFPPGSRIALLAENSIEYVIAFFAISQAGLVMVPLDTSAHPTTVNSILADCQALALVCQAKFERHLPAIIGENSSLQEIIGDRPFKRTYGDIALTNIASIVGEFDQPGESTQTSDSLSSDTAAANDLAAIFYTSGSTGASKGVMLSHQNLVANTKSTIEYLRLSADDSVLVILPFYYIYGNSLLLTHIAAGGRLVIENRFLYPEVVLDTMEKEEVTGFSGVPSNFIILLSKSTLAKRDLPALRYFTQAGGAMAPETVELLMNTFPTKEIFIMYGQTEASPRATWLPPSMLAEKIGSIGLPLSGVTIEIVNSSGETLPAGETGEIVISGDNVMLGYWNQPDDTAEVLRDGRLFTGDLARQDADGYLFIVGRTKEIIKSGGNRVSAKEVEECILRHDQVLEAAVIGIPDDLLGEAIVAVVVLKSSEPVASRALQDHCKRHLAAHKAPGRVVFVEALPKYQSGKINKPQLVRELA